MQSCEGRDDGSGWGKVPLLEVGLFVLQIEVSSSVMAWATCSGSVNECLQAYSRGRQAACP